MIKFGEFLEEGWKYIQYPSHGEAVEARKQHFASKCSGNACRLMPNGKLAHQGEFGGPKPNTTGKTNDDKV